MVAEGSGNRDLGVARRRPGHVDATRRREHGGQGDPLRAVDVRAVGGVDDRHVERLGQLHARQQHADGRDDPDAAHEARRGQPRRRRCRPDGHPDLRPAGGVHRRADGRAHPGVPRQEDPGGRDEARRALHHRHAAGVADVRRGVGGAAVGGGRRSSTPAPTGSARSSTTTRPLPTTTARRSPARAPGRTGTRSRWAWRC